MYVLYLISKQVHHLTRDGTGFCHSSSDDRLPNPSGSGLKSQQNAEKSWSRIAFHSLLFQPYSLLLKAFLLPKVAFSDQSHLAKAIISTLEKEVGSPPPSFTGWIKNSWNSSVLLHQRTPEETCCWGRKSNTTSRKNLHIKGHASPKGKDLHSSIYATKITWGRHSEEIPREQKKKNKNG